VLLAEDLRRLPSLASDSLRGTPGRVWEKVASSRGEGMIADDSLSSFWTWYLVYGI
jgi:hypothetical protein